LPQNNIQINEQQEYTELLKSIILSRKRGAVPLAYTHTYGCQGNAADGERINGMLSEIGFGFAKSPEDADLILYNTCAVREHAEDRVFGNVGALKNLKRRFPSTIIVLCGCMMQQEHVAARIQKSFPFVNLVFGTHALPRFPELLFKVITGGRRVFDIAGSEGTITEGLPIHRNGEIKAWVPIMYGCNNFCTYCIVPHVRGRERSREPQSILDEIRSLVSAGYKDITLLGQNVNSYGKTLAAPLSFAELLRQITQIEGDFWIRFMTSHPKDCTQELLEVMASSPKIAKHLHLPFQSGSNKILTAMNRKYTIEQYLEITAKARELMPELCITSDIIVGFPNEERADFLQTLEVLRQVEFASLFTFIFSPRKGTPAADMEDKLPHEEKAKWFAELLKVQEEYSAKVTNSLLGKELKVLVDSQSEGGTLKGRTEGNIIIEMEGDSSLIGSFVKAEVTQAKTWVIKGKII
jgi:tRNA-2-methylthio-N6-dimethylallyladenosine synthase